MTSHCIKRGFFSNILLSSAPCTGFLYIYIFDHLSYKLTASFLDDVFIIFYNAYAIRMNLRLCGFNFAVICLIILVALVLIRITLHLGCHIENPSIKDTFIVPNPCIGMLLHVYIQILLNKKELFSV